MEIHAAARKHDVPDEDIQHAVEHPIAWVRIGDDPARYLMAGPGVAGNLLELVVLATNTVELVIHAMPLRASTTAKVFGGTP